MRTERHNLAQQRSFMHRFFRDENNDLAVWDVPNPPLIAAMLSAFLQLLTTGRTSDFFGLVFFGSIFTWGWLELVSGRSLFRKTIGGLVLLGIIWLKLQGTK